MKNKKKQKWQEVSRIDFLKHTLGQINGVLLGVQRTKKELKEQEKEWKDYRAKIVDEIEYEEIKEKGGN